MDMSRKSILVLTIFTALALTLFLPGLSLAGSLEPSEPPGPTMKTLDEIYTRPVWHMFDKVFVDWPDNPRFAVCGNLVLDKETGLVWMIFAGLEFSWEYAQKYCNDLGWGYRLGWRLPTLQEVGSLVDWRNADPALPSGHPFIVMDGYSGGIWSATTYAGDNNKAWYVNFHSGNAEYTDKSSRFPLWCVRGGQGVDPQ